MHTRTDGIADGVYRISTFVDDVPPRGFTLNQFLLDAEEPLLYHPACERCSRSSARLSLPSCQLERLR